METWWGEVLERVGSTGGVLVAGVRALPSNWHWRGWDLRGRGRWYGDLAVLGRSFYSEFERCPSRERTARWRGELATAGELRVDGVAAARRGVSGGCERR